MTEDSKKRGVADYFRGNRDRMLGFVRRLIDDAADMDGEDIIQDVMVGIFSQPDFTVPLERLSAYIYTAIRNRVVDALRKRRRDLSLDAALSADGGLRMEDILSDARYDTADGFQREEIKRALYTALDGLSEEQRAIIVLTEFEGRSFRELAEEWEVPIGTLLSRKSRAMASVRKTMAVQLDSEKGGAL